MYSEYLLNHFFDNDLELKSEFTTLKVEELYNEVLDNLKNIGEYQMNNNQWCEIFIDKEFTMIGYVWKENKFIGHNECFDIIKASEMIPVDVLEPRDTLGWTSARRLDTGEMGQVYVRTTYSKLPNGSFNDLGNCPSEVYIDRWQQTNQNNIIS